MGYIQSHLFAIYDRLTGNYYPQRAREACESLLCYRHTGKTSVTLLARLYYARDSEDMAL